MGNHPLYGVFLSGLETRCVGSAMRPGGTDTQDAEDRVVQDRAHPQGLPQGPPQGPCPATHTRRGPLARLGPPKLLQTNLVQSAQRGRTRTRHRSLPWDDLVLARSGAAGSREHGRAPAQKQIPHGRLSRW